MTAAHAEKCRSLPPPSSKDFYKRVPAPARDDPHSPDTLSSFGDWGFAPSLAVNGKRITMQGWWRFRAGSGRDM